MNDTPITDFDKLKNTLIEIGVEFDEKVHSSADWQGIAIDTDVNTCTFGFTLDGSFIGVEID